MRCRDGRRRGETADWSTAEDLEYQLEGIGAAPEETLHGLDRMWAAILDEGEDFEGLDEDEVEAALCLQREARGRSLTGW